jgi:hypothetical protein
VEAEAVQIVYERINNIGINPEPTDDNIGINPEPTDDNIGINPEPTDGDGERGENHQAPEDNE